VLLVSQVSGLALLVLIVAVKGYGMPQGEFLAYAAVAGVGEIAGVAALYRGLAVGTMGIVTPVASIAPVVPLAVGIMQGEVPEPLQGAGLALILVGLVAAARGHAGPNQAVHDVGPSFLYGLLSALGFGIFFVAMDRASEGGIPWALLVARGTALTTLLVIAVVMRSRISAARADLPVLALIGILIVAADFSYATATSVGIMGVAAVLSALHTVVTIVLAGLILRERLGKLQAIGIATCIGGVLTLTAA